MRNNLFILVMVILSMFNVAKAESVKVGNAAPEFSLYDQTGKLHSIKDYAGQWLVLWNTLI